MVGRRSLFPIILLFLTLYAGISGFANYTITPFTEENGLNFSEIIEIQIDKNGLVWLTLDHNNLCYLDGYQIHFIPLKSDSPNYNPKVNPGGYALDIDGPNGFFSGFKVFKNSAWFSFLPKPPEKWGGSEFWNVDYFPVNDQEILLLSALGAVRAEWQTGKTELVWSHNQAGLGNYLHSYNPLPDQNWLVYQYGIVHVAIMQSREKTEYQFKVYAIDKNRFEFNSGIINNILIFTQGDSIYLKVFDKNDRSQFLCYKNGRWEDVFSDRGYSYLWPLDQNAYYFSKENELGAVSADGHEERIFTAENINQFLAKDKTLWVSARDTLLRCTPNLWQTPQSLAFIDDDVTNVLQDSQGHFWIKSSSGLYDFDHAMLTSYEIANDAIDKGITLISQMIARRHIYFDSEGMVFSGWFNIKPPFSHYFRVNPQRSSMENTGENNPLVLADQINGNNQSIYMEMFKSDQTSLPVIFSLNSPKGIFPVVNHDKQSMITIGEELVQNGIYNPEFVTCIFQSSDRDIWVAALKCLFQYRNGQLFNKYEGQMGNIRSIFEVEPGKIWAGGLNGLFEYKNLTWSSVRENIGEVNDIKRAKNGMLWISTSNGLYRMLNKEWLHFVVKNGLPSNFVFGIYEDREGKIWAYTQHGISVYHPEADTDQPIVSFPEQVNLSQKQVVPGGQVQLDARGTDKWNYSKPNQLLYSFKINQSDWTSYSSSNIFSATGLHTGKYSVEVRCMDNNGNVSKETSPFRFTVMYPWYRHPAFIAIVIFFVFLMILLAGYSIVQHIHLSSNYFKLLQTEKMLQNANLLLNANNTNLENLVIQRTASLQESEERFRNVYNNTVIGLFRAGMDGHVMMANPALLQMKGYDSLDELMKADVLHDIFWDPSEGEAGLALLAKTGTVSGQEIAFKRKDGSRIFVQVNAKTFYDQSGVPIYIEGTVEDISKRREAEKERIRLLQAIEQLKEIVVLTDAEGTIEYVNGAFETVTGYSAAEVTGKNPRILNSGKQEAAFYQEMWRTISNGKTWEGRIVNKKKNGTLYTEETTISPVFDSMNKIVHYISVKRDITRELDLEFKLRQSQKMEAIGVLAGGIAHDFNNILCAILGYSRLLYDDVKNNQKTRDRLEQVIKAGERAKNIVAQILTISRQTEGKKFPVILQPIVKEGMKFLRASIPSTIDIKTFVDPACGLVSADTAQIHQVVMNLCTNAYHAMQEDRGRLTVELKPFFASKENCQDIPDLHVGNYVCLSVSDTGHGMNLDILNRVFDPYFTTKEQGKGSGLGLSIVHGIVKQHNGAIDIKSESGKGTHVSVYFPVCNNEESKNSAAHPEKPAGTQRILVVDDEETIANLIQISLSEFGYQVQAYSDPVGALAHFRENPKNYDVVVTDLTMPKMTGIELAQSMHAVSSAVPVILCSGFNSDEQKQQANLAGISEFIEKPINMEQLGWAIRKTLDKQ